MYTKDQLKSIFNDINVLSNFYDTDNYFVVAHIVKYNNEDISLYKSHAIHSYIAYEDGQFVSKTLPGNKILTLVKCSLLEDKDSLLTDLSELVMDESEENIDPNEFDYFRSKIIDDIVSNSEGNDNYVTVWGKRDGKLKKLKSCESLTVSNLNVYQNLYDRMIGGSLIEEYKDISREMSGYYAWAYSVKQSIHSSDDYEFEGNRLSTSSILDSYTTELLDAITYCDLRCSKINQNQAQQVLQSLTNVSSQKTLEDKKIIDICNQINSLCERELKRLDYDVVSSLYKSISKHAVKIHSKMLFYEKEKVSPSNADPLESIFLRKYFSGLYDESSSLYDKMKHALDKMASLFQLVSIPIDLEEMNDCNNIELLEFSTYLSSLKVKGNRITYILEQSEAACLADYIYEESDLFLLGDWKEAGFEVKDKLKRQGVDFGKSDAVSGYRSNLYVKNKDGVDYYCFVTCGTNMEDFTYDWPTNFRQGLTGLDSEQYLKTIKNALIIDEYLKDKPLCFVGHSLGGGLATVNAIATGRCAVTFNPAGIKQSTLDRVNVEDPESLVTNYVVRGEVLNEYINNKQGDLFDWGSYFGKIIYVNPKCEGGSSIDKHGMCHFLNNQYYSECLKKQCRECLKNQCRECLKNQCSECLKYQCSECLNECE
jgi:hypothetical protein